MIALALIFGALLAVTTVASVVVRERLNRRCGELADTIGTQQLEIVRVKAECERVRADRRRLLMAAAERAFSHKDMRHAFRTQAPEAYLRHLLDDGQRRPPRMSHAETDDRITPVDRPTLKLPKVIDP